MLDTTRYLLSDLNHRQLNKLIGQAFMGLYPVWNSRSRCKYFEVPCSFDIETSSFLYKGKKAACMYMFAVNLNGIIFRGRTWAEFVDLLHQIHTVLDTWEGRRLILYVHNLAYEMQFIRKWLHFEKVFALDQRVPVYAVTDEGIEFRCSYILSGYGLAKLADQCTLYPCKKMVGDLDYTLLRTPSTDISETEWNYLDQDTVVVVNYIRQKLETEQGFSGIQITKTGYVRKYTREKCLVDDDAPGARANRKSKKYLTYHDYISNLTLTPEMYRMWRRAFQGGYTHASIYWADRLIDAADAPEGLDSWDFTSSYPFSLMLPFYPINSGEKVENISGKQFRHDIRKYMCIFDVEFEDLENTFPYDFYISYAHAYLREKCECCNGRVMSAGRIRMTITSLDWEIIRRTYKWKKMRVTNFVRYQKGYLPKDLILSILELYRDKTKLKNVVGKEMEYLNSKENVNAEYGQMVTSIDRDTITYDSDTGEWGVDACILEDVIQKYNENRNRVLYYPWGVVCTAVARFNLWTGGIIPFKSKYVYSDTDSCKVIKTRGQEKIIERYNRRVDEALRTMCKTVGIDFSLTRPKDIKGNEHPLGQWDHDAHYTRFKTLRAKAYMVEYEDEDGKRTMNLTVSGLNKKVAIPYLRSRYKSNTEMFRHFDDDMFVPECGTGKLCHTYIDDEIEGDVIDYQGKEGHFHEKSCVHLSGTEYSLSLADEYIMILRNYQEALIPED